MKQLKGITASPGIARGVICCYSGGSSFDVPHYLVPEKDTDLEVARLEEALDKTRARIKALANSPDTASDTESVKGIIRAHMMILEDASIREKAVNLIRDGRVNAEHAVEDAFDGYLDVFKGKSGHFAEIAHDVEDVKLRLLGALLDEADGFACPIGERQPVIVAAKKLVPSMVLNIPREHVLAYVTEEGGITTHASILARSYGVPVLYGIDIEREIECGQSAVVDATLGKLILDPDVSTEEEYRLKMEKAAQSREFCRARKLERPRDASGAQVKLSVNITSLEDADLARGTGCDGVGLLRTEFLFKGGDRAPSLEEQLTAYERVLEATGGGPVTIRLLDVSGDKAPGYMHLPPQENPDLGIRGARAAAMYEDIYLTQTKAVLRAAEKGAVRLLYPMISDLSDLVSFRRIVDKARRELGIPADDLKGRISEGIMIEIPAAALNAGMLLAEVDFVNLGTNDLLQYTLAAERGSRFVEERYHIMHPALVRLMRMVVQAACQADKEVCLCGEIASFGSFYPVLLGIGLNSFSVPPAIYDDLKCQLLYKEPITAEGVERFLRLPDKPSIDRFFRE